MSLSEAQKRAKAKATRRLQGYHRRGVCDMTDKEIIKALGCHANDSTTCYECPYRTDGMCSISLCNDALNLINRQQAEIERLLQKLQQPQTEAIKEVFDKIKAVNRWSCVDIRYFDKVYKEMVGEDK